MKYEVILKSGRSFTITEAEKDKVIKNMVRTNNANNIEIFDHSNKVIYLLIKMEDVSAIIPEKV